MHIAVTLLSYSLLLPLAAGVSTTITNSWDGGFEAEACVPVTQELNGWTLSLTFDEDVWWVEVWIGDATKISNREYTITSDMHQSPGDQICFDIVGQGDGDIRPTGTVTIVGGPSKAGSGSQKNYADALAKSILFYDTQRSGRLPADNPIPWRGDSNVDDCVPGGWHDAGDHVKFGLPLSSAATLLGWSLVQFKDGYEKAGQLDQMYDMIKWIYDYFLRAWNPGKQELCVQVGDGYKDHAYWGRPEDMNMDRPCKFVNETTPGADIVGGTAAALAAGSIGFRAKDSAYADRLLNAAMNLYSFAKGHRGVFSGGAPFYFSSGDADEMCEGAMWLYKATGDQSYLIDAKGFVDLGVAWGLGWDDKKIACQSLLYEATREDQYKQAVEGFFNSWFPGGGITYTPCGLAWRDKWGSNRFAGNSAFMALLAAEMGLQPSTYRKWAVEQINYLLGDNSHDGGCFSYEIGYGSKFPRNPHHRAASCPDRPAPCTDDQLYAWGSSPHVLNGALVGGPDENDKYKDERADYIQNEVAIDYNAGFHGALAGIVHLKAVGKMPVTNNKCPC
ncbi:hypothetical protein RRG08_040955 [Elysia crispata]|uniref:Endoglucanase n=1 Tax=Elysia crispata TaxID=231223 RepID=A0AAE1E1D7_9GAST|nr:hypothetical protein RRG08_040955 [Elysia crispata]